MNLMVKQNFDVNNSKPSSLNPGEYDYYSPSDLLIPKSKFNNLKEEVLYNGGDNEFNSGEGVEIFNEHVLF